MEPRSSGWVGRARREIDLFLAWLLAACQGAALEPKARQEEIPLALRVNRAIARGVHFLEDLQQPDGSFPGHAAQHPGGATALVAYTLLSAGVRKTDPVLRRALAALEGNEFASVYAASVHLLLCEVLRDPVRRRAAQHSLDFLLEHQEKGVWAYPWGHLCNSNTQFALLALRAARRMELEVPDGVFVEAAGGLAQFKNDRGGFVYTPAQRDSYAGMTAASLASFAVLRETGASSSRLRTVLERHTKTIAQAESWLEARFDAQRNLYDDGSWQGTWQTAYLWAIERWCGLTGRERIGTHDWYTEGADWLLGTQGRDGALGLEGGLENTCFALLFLRRATVSGGELLDEIYAEIDRRREELPAPVRRPGPGAIRLTDWWLAGPWAQGGGEPILLDPPFDPAAARPREDGKVARREWKRVTLARDSWSDLEGLAERDGNRQLWAVATWLSVPVPGSAPGPTPEPGEGLEARLWFEFEDGWDVWLDGVRLARERRRNPKVTPDVSFLLRLTPGKHLLTVLVEDRTGPSAFGAQLAGVRGGPPPSGLREDALPPAAR